jgi:hypothetical protein
VPAVERARPVNQTSGTGGSAATQAADADPCRWESRRTTALAIRFAAFAIPFAASFLAARVLRHTHIDTKDLGRFNRFDSNERSCA